MTTPDAMRQLLGRLLDWEDAHTGFDAAVANVPLQLRGTAPDGLPYSAWQLVEHLRLAQRDILDFCINADYKEMRWPDDYWPSSPVPPSSTSWDDSISRFKEDRAALQRLALDPALDLTATIPHGQGQTYAREIVLAADHASYHVGQLVALRRLLGCWPAERDGTPAAVPLDAPTATGAEPIRAALIAAAADAYEDASIRGLCAEGAWEAAVSAMRSLRLQPSGE